MTTGEAQVIRDDGEGERQVGTVAPGCIVGELSVLRGAPRSATVAATRPVTGYAGDAHAFSTLLDVPGVAERVARTARQRLSSIASGGADLSAERHACARRRRRAVARVGECSEGRENRV